MTTKIEKNSKLSYQKPESTLQQIRNAAKLVLNQTPEESKKQNQLVEKILLENWKRSAETITNDIVFIAMFVNTMRELDKAFVAVKKIEINSIKHIIKNSMEDIGPEFYQILPWNIDLIIRMNHRIKVENEEKLRNSIKLFIEKQTPIELEKVQNESNGTEENGGFKNSKKSAPEYNTLEEIFISIEAFKIVMNLLIRNDLIDKNSFKWTDNSPGYKSKIVALLYHLYYNNYFNCTELPKPEQMGMLTQNGFGVRVSIRTIKGKGKLTEARKEFSFIKRFAS